MFCPSHLIFKVPGNQVPPVVGGPAGELSHLTEVLNQKIFSGSSWECLVITGRRQIDLTFSRVVASLLRRINLPSLPPDAAQVTLINSETVL